MWRNIKTNLEEEIKQFVGVDDKIVHSFYSKQVELENFHQTMSNLGYIIENSLDERFTLDLYLVADKNYIDEIKEYIGDSKKVGSQSSSIILFLLLFF